MQIRADFKNIYSSFAVQTSAKNEQFCLAKAPILFRFANRALHVNNEREVQNSSNYDTTISKCQIPEH